MSTAPIDVTINDVQTAIAPRPNISRILSGLRIVEQQRRRLARAHGIVPRGTGCVKCITQHEPSVAMIYGQGYCAPHAHAELFADRG